MGTKHLRVLLVEDDATDRTMFEGYVAKKKLAYDLVLADKLADANAHLADGGFDIALTEYQLSDGSGLSVLRHARPTPCIIVTRVAARSVVINVMKEGAYDFVIKDSQWEYVRTLPAVIEEALERRRLRAQAGYWRPNPYDVSGQAVRSYRISASSREMRSSSEPSYSSDTK